MALKRISILAVPLLFCSLSMSAISDPILLSGFVQWYELGDGDAFALNQQGYFQNARLDLSGDLNKHVNYSVEYNFALGGRLTNAFINYRNNNYLFTVGQFKVPWNSVYMESSRFLWFNEFPLPLIAFNPDFRSGGAYSLLLQHWRLAVSFFTPGTKQQTKIEPPYGSTQRVTYLFWNAGSDVMHVSLGNWYQSYAAINAVNYGAIPEAKGYLPVRTISTGTIGNVHSADTVNIEWLYQHQRFATEAALIGNITPRSSASTLLFYGGYLQASYFLTPTYLKYNESLSVFGGPSTLTNAWQLVFRVSGLDLNSNNIQGGAEINASTGINVYFMRHFRLGLNYVFAYVMRSTTFHNGSDQIFLVDLEGMF